MPFDNFNITAVRKTIGAILHRINEETLYGTIRVRIIDRQIADLLDTLPDQFHPLLHTLIAANLDRDYVKVIANLDLLTRILPPMTYGALPAGHVFRLEHGLTLYVKRKHGVEAPLALLEHFPAGTVVIVVND